MTLIDTPWTFDFAIDAEIAARDGETGRIVTDALGPRDGTRLDSGKVDPVRGHSLCGEECRDSLDYGRS
jgi:hypothetical protein